MKIADHAYVENGLGAINDYGYKPCAICGHGPGAHAMRAVPMEDDSKGRAEGSR